MKILVIGDENRQEECRNKFGESHHYTFERALPLSDLTDPPEVIFDFLLDPKADRRKLYDGTELPVFFNASTKSVAAMKNTLGKAAPKTTFGFAGLPTFLNRDTLEVALSSPGQADILTDICRRLETAFEVVEDRVGLVTPRVIGMIINEAYFTVQDGTATRADIDTAMKFGTHYPFGPFEWCRRIGLGNVYDLLSAVYEETQDKRYAICSLMKEEYQLL